MPLWPVNQRRPVRSKTAVLRLAFALLVGKGKSCTFSVIGSTRTIAFSPPSVTHGAPSGPTMTPCGADPWPSLISRIAPVAGSRRPSSPASWPVYQTLPSGAGATSCGVVPRGTRYSRTSTFTACCTAGEASAVARAGDAVAALREAVAAADADAGMDGEACVAGRLLGPRIGGSVAVPDGGVGTGVGVGVGRRTPCVQAPSSRLATCAEASARSERREMRDCTGYLRQMRWQDQRRNINARTPP